MRSRRDDGVSYVEMLIALTIAGLLFPPAYRFASSVLKLSVEEVDALFRRLAIPAVKAIR